MSYHCFPDGNGRTFRLIMNYQLMTNGFPPVSIA
ncbi:Fic family protein [Enterocloster bolteae]